MMTKKMTIMKRILSRIEEVRDYANEILERERGDG